MGKYQHIWQKYRPAILSLMVASDNEPQTYQLSSHEFMDVNLKKKTGYSFTMRYHQNRAITPMKSSLLAPDLLLMLQESNTAIELSDSSVYEFELDKNYVLHIRKDPDNED
jgi:hypothetical protein